MNWVAVSVMVPKGKTVDVVDRLADVGAHLVTEIKNERMGKNAAYLSDPPSPTTA
ncbi:hypothetical protein HDU96_001705 [Phlyctochytrium bullatum]|nr:hypothetical protein HDU96_001705 [Phlyctochytrium bullatum]